MYSPINTINISALYQEALTYDMIFIIYGWRREREENGEHGLFGKRRMNYH
jgi:hypothetical protein